MAWQRPKKPYCGRLYTCAEDLCDPWEAAASEADHAARAKSRAHAVRLMDEPDMGLSRASSAPHAYRPSASASPTEPSVSEMPSGKSRALTRSESGSSAPLYDSTETAAPARPLPRTARRKTDTGSGKAGKMDASDSAYAVLSVKPSGEGETIAVVLSVPAGTDATAASLPEESPETIVGEKERLRLYLLIEQYAELKPREGSIPRACAEELLVAGRLCDAVKRGVRLLQYGDRSARQLAYRLTTKGITREDAARAVAYLVEKGYIREDDTARLRAEQNVRKLRGPRRIREDLRANGFSDDAVAEAMASLENVDFEESCVALIRKKYRTVPDDRAERQRMIASLTRMGYDYELVRAAMRRIEREE